MAIKMLIILKDVKQPSLLFEENQSHSQAHIIYISPSTINVTLHIILYSMIACYL